VSGIGTALFLTTRNSLDCDQSNYSSRVIVFSDIPFEFGQTGSSFVPSIAKLTVLTSMISIIVSS